MPHAMDWKEFAKSNPYVEDPEKSFCLGTHTSQQSNRFEKVLLRTCGIMQVIRKQSDGQQSGGTMSPVFIWRIYRRAIFFTRNFKERRGSMRLMPLAPHFIACEKFAATCPFIKPPKVASFQTLQ
jgi:hypothetical protein